MLSVQCNEDFSKFLINCSDRVLRLYWIDYSAISSSCRVTSVFILIDCFRDVINNQNRWINMNFLELNERTKIVSQHPI